MTKTPMAKFAGAAVKNMSDFLLTVAASVVVAPVLILVRAAYLARSHRGPEITNDVLVRILPSVAAALRSTKIRVFRSRHVSHMYLAAVGYVFPHTFISLDYAENRLSQTTESFAIAHELAHYKNGDVYWLLFDIVLPQALCGAIAANAVTMHPTLETIARGVAMIASIITLYFAWGRYYHPMIERRADSFAARYVGREAAVAALREVRATYRGRDKGILHGLERRIELLS